MAFSLLRLAADRAAATMREITARRAPELREVRFRLHYAVADDSYFRDA